MHHTRSSIARLGLACGLALAGSACFAQSVLHESPLGLGLFGFNLQKIDRGELGGDARKDLLLLRRGPDGRGQGEVWERADGTASGFRLRYSVGLAVDQVALDVDSDGDEDIVSISPYSPAQLGVRLNTPDGFVNAPGSLARAGMRALLPYYFAVSGEPSLVGVLLVSDGGGGQGVVSFLHRSGDSWNQLGGDLVHPGGAAAVSDGFGLAGPGEGNFVLTLGAPPQRLWRAEGETWVPHATFAIDREVVRVLKIELDGDDFVDLITVASNGQVDAWRNLGGEAGNALGDVAWLGALGDPAHGPVTALEFIPAPAPDAAADILVARRRPDGSHQAQVFAIDRGTQAIEVSWQRLLDAAAIEYEPFSGVLYAGGADGLRSYTRAPAEVPPTAAIGFIDENNFAWFLEDGGGALPLRASAPLPAALTLTGDSATAAYQTQLLPGQRSGALVVPGDSADATTEGTFVVTLRDPGVEGVVLAAETVATVYVLSLSGGSSGSCVSTSLMVGDAAAAAKGGAPGSSPYMGSLAELDTVRDLRDQVLAQSPRGRDYIAFHERFGPEIFELTFLRPDFYGTLWQAKNAWMPVIESLVAGDGSAPITAPMVELMERVFEHYESNGSLALAQAIRGELDALQPQALVDQPVSQLADTIAALPALGIHRSGFEPQ